ncbi:hypothetical protein [Citrobacter braakii]|uniref:hypothetical protein n=1 Tax=Citrobacter braakii TaxID=57706 RepID=UPI0040398899
MCNTVNYRGVSITSALDIDVVYKIIALICGTKSFNFSVNDRFSGSCIPAWNARAG